MTRELTHKGWPLVSRQRLQELQANGAFLTKSDKDGIYRLYWDERSGGVYVREEVA